LEDSVLIN